MWGGAVELRGTVRRHCRSADAGRRVLAGEFRPGFQTPATLFGNGFAETIADTTVTDIEE